MTFSIAPGSSRGERAASAWMGDDGEVSGDDVVRVTGHPGAFPRDGGAPVEFGDDRLPGLITGWALRTPGEPGVLRRGVTTVGRTAPSCHALQDLAASALRYGWGPGLADALDGARPWWPPGARGGVL
ncbi:hypothetical protein [Streptomyces sp. ST2-7A]|uniref:hypothetical protein n=1 Tax=Streptomyces sp. ST2-7A TaxID=2907214 RepID=UPI001F445F06|nr:hypothetical protein [Streptomyces sp. ST2-7A]MCE7080051.1 hypothetical protein [Streptomyces sp. ST2-7A]